MMVKLGSSARAGRLFGPFDHHRIARGRLGMKAASRRLYVTERGYIGLCNKSVKAGDQVHVLSGGHVPFILRPIEAEHTETGNCCYSFMGDTYIHGLMNGEALTRKDFEWAEVYIK